MEPNTAGQHVNYLEIYEPDVLADEMQPVQNKEAWNLSQRGLLLDLFLAPSALIGPHPQAWPAWRCRGCANQRQQSKVGEISNLYLEPKSVKTVNLV
jgi:hypothetical protein